MSYWWCPSCKRELYGINVTYEENCEICGSRVVSVEEEVTQEEVELAVEKQKARKPIVKPFHEIMRNQTCYDVICPTCGYKLNILEFMGDRDKKFKDMSKWQKHCYECGQKLDWD